MSTNLESFLSGVTIDPLRHLAEVLSLGPEMLDHAVVLLAGLILFNDLVRTALMAEATRSVVQHLLLCVLTLLPAILLGAVLLWAGYRHPERAWLNLGLAAALYLPWYIGGSLTRLSRSDTEGADVGWMAMGALITFPLGLVAALAF